MDSTGRPRNQTARANYGKDHHDLTRAIHTCQCHGREFGTREMLRIHVKAYHRMVMKDLATLVAEHKLAGNAWDRLPGEPPMQYGRFKTYLTTLQKGQRSVMRTAAILGLRWQTLTKVMATWNWKLRAELLDQHIDREELEEHIRLKKESARKQANLGRKLQTLANAGAESLLQDHDRISEMTGHEIAKLADFGVKIERLANNDPTQIEADKTVRIVWEGPRPDWAPEEPERIPLPAAVPPATIEGER